MNQKDSTPKPRPYVMWERSYAIVIVSFGILTGISLGYGIWAAFEFADTAAAADLARLLTSGFLFLFSGLSAVAMWLRLINVQDNRWLLDQVKETLKPKEEESDT